MSIPDWCAVRRGRSALLLVAPHGGRRPPVDAAHPPPNLRVNDVNTPELTRQLAQRLDAGVIINEGQDRNTLDLNRTSQVLRNAPWFLDLIVRELEAIIGRSGHAEVLFVHGWNVGQPKCDIGIGAVEVDGELRVPDGAGLTVSDAYYRQRITQLRAMCAAADVLPSVGERYPASHRNNLLQLFTAHERYAEHAGVQQIVRWVRAGQLDAMQLEIGLPLRWPGPWRDRFLDVLTSVFGEKTVPETLEVQRAPSPEPRAPISESRTSAPTALQFYDAASEVGMFAGVGRMGPHLLGARMLLFLGGQCVALFTGEDRSGRGHGVPPLAIGDDGQTLTLQFRGPILLMDDAAIYLDLEAALAASRLVEADVALRFQTLTPAGAASIRFGSVEGSVGIDGQMRAVCTGGFANAGGLRAAGTAQQTMIAADFGGTEAVLTRQVHDLPHATAWHYDGAAVQALGGGRVAVATDGDVYTPSRLDFACEGRPALRGWPLSHMGILRGNGSGAYLRVTFGVARFEWGGRVGFGLYEHARPIA